MNESAFPRFSHVEIEINSACDQNCKSCDRFIDWAPAPHMTVAQVKHFVDESLALDWEWERIHILGGEPTLHPQFREIVEELLRYREAFPGAVLLRVISNGSGKLAEHRAWLESAGVAVSVESKVGGFADWFTDMGVAPVDHVPGPQPACSIFGIKGCGVGLTRHGYFLCGAGASIARVVGLDIGAQRLEDMTYERALAQAEQVCNLCGHKEGFFRRVGRVEARGPFWTQAVAAYQAQRPALTVYGGQG